MTKKRVVKVLVVHAVLLFLACVVTAVCGSLFPVALVRFLVGMLVGAVSQLIAGVVCSDDLYVLAGGAQ